MERWSTSMICNSVVVQPSIGRNDLASTQSSPVIFVASRCLSRSGLTILAWSASRVSRRTSGLGRGCSGDAVTICAGGDSGSFDLTSFVLPACVAAVFGRLELVDLREDAGCARGGPVNGGGAKSIPDEDGGGGGANVLLLEVVVVIATVEFASKSKPVPLIRDR
jgi:hypothetical protein